MMTMIIIMMVNVISIIMKGIIMIIETHDHDPRACNHCKPLVGTQRLSVVTNENNENDDDDENDDNEADHDNADDENDDEKIAMDFNQLLPISDN